MSLLVQIIVLLGAALVLVPLGKRLGIASVLGYLFTGILLGPSVLHIASDSKVMQELADFGVILLMFLIGLELRPQRLWQMRHSIFVMGSLQVGITGLALMAILLFLFKLNLANSFILGFALALSSTAFVLQLLFEKKQLATTYGQRSFSILLFQDIAAIPLLAVIPLLAGEQSTHHGISYFAAIVATFTGLFLFSRYVMRPFFRFIAKSGATELITAVGLFIILSVVALMNLLDISTTLGAFLTGVLLADSEFRHELEASIAPFKGLLLGLFFMTVGMSTQISLFVDMPWLIIGGAIGLMLIKTLIMIIIARFNKYDWPNSLLLATCLSQGGEFAFVVLSVANQNKVLSQSLLEPTTLIVTLSMMLTPIFYWIMRSKVIPFIVKEEAPQFDDIPEQPNTMIIAGFGRFGQIIARIAHLHQIRFTAIDNNLQRIDFVRRYGGTLYYGDVTYPNILQAAGIQKAKIFVLAIDDVEDSMNVARYLRLNYPDLEIFARARDRHHVHLLRDIGITHIWREIYLSSLGMAYGILRNLGVPEEKAYDNIEAFRKYDEKLLDRQQSIYMDEQKVIASQQDMLSELEHLFDSDNMHYPIEFEDNPQSPNRHSHINIGRDNES